MGASGIMKEFFMGFSEKFRKIYRKNDVQEEMNKCTFEKDYMERAAEKNRSVCLFRGRKIFCVYGEKSSLIRTRYV